ncbi:MAG: tetratricopeptide repeat protein [Saprospiraceae bacterium]|nr:tetratricopeptide repeat protein [Saprospiraceae bacterium]
MRSIYTLLSLIFTFVLSIAQPDLTTEQWQEDVRWLQQKIINDYRPLFHKITLDDWNKHVDDLYHNIPEMEDHEVMVGIAEIVAKFGYGHTAFWLTAWRYNRLKDFHQMPYNLYWFPEGIYVQGVHQYYEEALGAKVIKVGNVTVEEAIEAIRPVVSAENEQFFKAHGLNYLGVPEVLNAKGVIDDMSQVTLTLEKNGKQYEITFKPRPSEQLPGYYGLIQSQGEWLDARPGNTTPLWLKHLYKKYYMEYLENDKVVYVRQSEVQDDPEENIEQFYGRVFDFIDNNEVEKLVIDLRLNSGGNNYKNKPIIKGLIQSKKINQPGELFVILGRRTFSACQNLVNEIENYTNAIFVGEPTAENVNFFGDNRVERLPNSDLPIRLSYLWWQDKDPRDNREWTPPHIAVEMSFEDYISNRDPVLEHILKNNTFEKPVEPWDHLASLFMAGKMDELKSTAVEFVNDPKYRFYDFEGRMNDAGYQLLGAERFEEAIMVLTLTTDLFPDSANAWDSLAEAHYRAGNIEKAKELYNKAMKMDPEGPTGQNAKMMLEKIN